MEKTSKNFLEKKKLLMELNSNELNKKVFYLINEARTSPKQFYHHLIYNNKANKNIINLSFFFKYFSKETSTLILDKNISICSQDLLTHLISIDDGKYPFKYSQEEKTRNSLKSRLKRLNLIPINYNNFIIIGADNSLNSIINLFLNEDYKNKILSPEMNLIGIASGLLPSEDLCIIIDIAHALVINNDHYYSPMKNYFIRNKYKNYDNQGGNENNRYYNDNKRYKNLKNSFSPLKNDRKNMEINNSTNNNKWNRDLYINDTKKEYHSLMLSPYRNKNEKVNDYFPNKYNSYEYYKNKDGFTLRTNEQKNNNINNVNNIDNNSILSGPKEYKIPISVYIDKQYIKDKKGKIIPIYTREITYDDGSILIQPDIEDYKDM